MSFQSLLQQEAEEQRWPGYGWGTTSCSSYASHRLRVPTEDNFVQDGDAGVLRSGGGGGGGGRGSAGACGGELAALTVNNSGGGSVGGYGGDFPPSDLFSLPSRRQQQQVSSPFNWQSFLGGGQPGSRWQPDTTSWPAIEPAGSVIAYAQAEDNVKRVAGSGVVRNALCQARESSGSDGVISEVEKDPSGELKEEWRNNVNSEKENWRKFGDFMVGDVKQEESEHIQEAGYILGDDIKSRKRYIQSASQEHPEFVINFEPSASSSESDSDSEASGRRKRESLSRKRRRPGQDADGNITWTDESVRFLFETYDAIHQRLWEESKGQVKYQKKWTPILKAMQARFGNHFTKKQCQSKYWSVRRECTEYRIMSTKAAATDPMWNPSIAGRELLKPKFYDVWLDVSGKNQEMVSKTKSSTVKGEIFLGELLKGESSRVLDKDGQPLKQRLKESGGSMKEMQRLMLVELQASEKREEAMKYRAELIMELLTQHIEHVENRVNTIDESRNPQLHLLERVNLKLEKVLEGLSALNQHLSKMHRCTENDSSGRQL